MEEVMLYKNYPQYKGVYYKYHLPTDKVEFGIWSLSDTEHGYRNRMTFNADIYRIDQCFDLWFKQMLYGSIGVWQTN